MKDLGEKGYVVIPDVCSAHDCDKYVAGYHDWLAQFGDDDWPLQMQSIISNYYIGHFENTWKARLQTKPVFASIWGTDKLLTSLDAVAISFPPESQKYGVYDVGKDWLHFDQSSNRSGLHAYQGALYLEESTESDYCFRVMPGSHEYFDEFYKNFAGAEEDYRQLSQEETEWYKEKGCVVTKVAVPKGGMVIWDSRLVHDNCKPVKGRPNSDRWRFVVFVCMTPALWATPEDMKVKKDAYRLGMMTSHWSSQDINSFESYDIGHFNSIDYPGAKGKNLPDVAKTKAARLLCGDLEYDFKDGKGNGPSWQPAWKKKYSYGRPNISP